MISMIRYRKPLLDSRSPRNVSQRTRCGPKTIWAIVHQIPRVVAAGEDFLHTRKRGMSRRITRRRRAMSISLRNVACVSNSTRGPCPRDSSEVSLGTGAWSCGQPELGTERQRLTYSSGLDVTWGGLRRSTSTSFFSCPTRREGTAVKLSWLGGGGLEAQLRVHASQRSPG